MAESSSNESEDTKLPEIDVGESKNEDILKQLGSDFAGYMKIDINDEKQEFEDSIEDMLTRLDEFCGLVDMIRSDTNLCLGRTLPTIHKKCLEMEKMFERIDQLEAFVQMVSKDVSAVEQQVEKAEDEMGSLSGIKKVFKSFSLPPFLSKKTQSKETVGPSKTKYTPPYIFNTDMFLYTDTPRGASATPSESRIPVIPAVLPSGGPHPSGSPRSRAAGEKAVTSSLSGASCESGADASVSSSTSVTGTVIGPGTTSGGAGAEAVTPSSSDVHSSSDSNRNDSSANQSKGNQKHSSVGNQAKGDENSSQDIKQQDQAGESLKTEQIKDKTQLNNNSDDSHDHVTGSGSENAMSANQNTAVDTT